MSFIKPLGLSVALLAPIAAHSQSLTFSDYGPNRGARAAALETFGANLAEQGIDLTFFWGGSLIGGRGTLQGLADNVADMGSVVGFFTPAQLPLYSIGDLPVENSDTWIGMSAMHELAKTNDALKAEFDAAGVHYVSTYSTSPIQLICSDKVDSLDDMKGLRVRASGPYGDALTELGAEVVRMSQADVYQALDSGLLDCNQNYYYSIVAYKQYEVANQILALDWGQNMSFGIFMGKATYEGLSDVAKAAIDAAGDAFIDIYSESLIDGLKSDRAALEGEIDGNAIDITELADADKKTLRDASNTQIEAWVARVGETGGDGKALLAEYHEIIDRKKAELDKQGYPWAR
ncbi:C4-dicarboxylate TRAP transporter substrate-binding protein [Sulfitobacter sp. M22]|uniref:C4-dicarboxylate TRAP transporter substrate-binding protein n=1 Tax=Sulfitobacter sp. M22 TaxID=2675332 RepID=UPI001F380D36|nr:C4-dicarboxylate TRAP transporter substrate-binding protein [Sulfitobacter sp. M22]MCF7728135.1 ABC transporter substrate-binding protein [Sulfitobacter sp. M22]